MKKYVFIILAVLIGFYMFGCGKKEVPPSEMQEAMSMEALNALNANTTVIPLPDATKPEVTVLSVSPAAEPVTTAKPSVQEIQTALKSAGYYTGAIDGKIGPKTKKAIEDFQKASNLKADGKVGSKTWSLLSKYLNAPSAAATPAKM